MTTGRHTAPAASVSRERVATDDGIHEMMAPLETDEVADGGAPREIALEDLCLDAGTQLRARLDQATIAEYARDLLDGDQLPPVAAVSDGATTWLIDGFHRIAAARRAGRTSIQTMVRIGTHRDAIIGAAGANRDHGLRRTRADKQRAIQALLADPEWAAWSDHRIADACGVNQTTVSRIRARSAESAGARPPTRRAIRRGAAYDMRVASHPAAQEAEPAVAPELIPAAAAVEEGEGTGDRPAPPCAWPEAAGNGRRDAAGITAEWRNLANDFMVEAQARLRAGETGTRDGVPWIGLRPETVAALACGWHPDGPIPLDDGLLAWPAGLVIPAYDGAGLLSEVLLLTDPTRLYRLGPCPEAPIWWPPQTATPATAAVFVCQDSLMGLYRWQASKGRIGVLVLSPGEFARRLADLIPPPLSSIEEGKE